MTTKEIIGPAETAAILGISKTSIRNWVRHGYLQPLENTRSLFYLSSVKRLKDDIQKGKLDRLKKRANKSKAGKKFIPIEYIEDIDNRQKVNRLVEYILANQLDVPMVIFVLALNCFRQKEEVKKTDLKTILTFARSLFERENVYSELKEFYNTIAYSNYGLNKQELACYEVLLQEKLPLEKDVLGIIYQSLIGEGEKANLGSYYTPGDLVRNIVGNNIQDGARVLDPCCGTGQFLLAFAEHLDKPENIYGFDLDQTAVRIARINLLLLYPGEFQPKVFYCDTLKDIDYLQPKLLRNHSEPVSDHLGKFDFIATNPPWGAEIENNILTKLKGIFPQIRSKESFSFFLSAALSLLKVGGIVSFVLPEAVLNVSTHADIRETILDCCQIKTIRCHGKKFKNVFSPVITLDLHKVRPISENKVNIERGGIKYTIKQGRFSENQQFIFDVYLNDKDKQIIDKVYAKTHTTLEGQAEWALGIVTGDNGKYLVKELAADANLEPIYKGIDVDHYKLKQANTYIRFRPQMFQQVAPEAKYRAKEKLIYKFISDTLVFAYDKDQRLTLNSANIVIPNIPNYPIKVVLALFNSSLYTFIHRKKFSSIKVLRGNLEQLPLPLWDWIDYRTTSAIIDRIVTEKDNDCDREKLDSFIFNKFELTEEEKQYVKQNLRNGAEKA